MLSDLELIDETRHLTSTFLNLLEVGCCFVIFAQESSSSKRAKRNEKPKPSPSDNEVPMSDSDLIESER